MFNPDNSDDAMFRRFFKAMIYNFDEKRNGALAQLFEPFLTPSILAEAIGDITPKYLGGRGGETLTGKRLYDAVNDEDGVIFSKIFSHLLQTINPTTFKQAGELLASLDGEVNRAGDKYDTREKVLKLFLGLGYKKENPQLSYRYVISDLSKRLQNDRIVEAKVQGIFLDRQVWYEFREDGDYLFKSINVLNPTGPKLEQGGTGNMILSSTGIQSDGTNYLETGIIPSGNFQMGDASFWFNVVENNGGTIVQVRNSGSNCVKFAAASTFQYFNSTGNKAISNLTGVGTRVISRDTTTNLIYAKDGIVTETETFIADLLPDEQYRFLVNGESTASTTKIAYMIAGANVNGKELIVHNTMEDAPAVTLTGGYVSSGYEPLVFSGDYGTYDAPTTTFTFDKTLANITEGEVSSAIALNNKLIMNEALDHAVNTEGATKFIIDNTDFFIENANSEAGRDPIYQSGIKLSYDNFTFEMGTGCHIRVQPNAGAYSTVLGVWATTNITIKGGNLHGDRYTHDYTSKGGIQDENDGIFLVGVIDSTIDNVFCEKFTGDGLVARSTSDRNSDGTEPVGETFTLDLDIKNCTFTDCRRNGFAFTDGKNINAFSNLVTFNGLDATGTGEVDPPADSGGVIPRHGLDIEPITAVIDEFGNTDDKQLVQYADIYNNTFAGNNADIDFYKGYDIDVHDNTFDSKVGNVASYRINIYDNVFTARAGLSTTTAAINIKAVIRGDGSHWTKDWQVYGNTIIGYDKGILAGGEGQNIYSNTITDCDNGISLGTGKDNTITDNIISSSLSGSVGVTSFVLGVDQDSVTISGGSIDVDDIALELRKITGLNDGLVIDNVDMLGKIEITDSDNVTVKNSTFNITEDITNSTNITFTNNNSSNNSGTLLKYTDTEWTFNIVHGVVSDEVAITNVENMNLAFTYAVDNGYDGVELDSFDAYFGIGAVNFGNLIHIEAIQVPSNFHVKMSSNTYLRVQPTDQIAYAVLSARSVDNVLISGGNLIGDKYEHTYVTGTQVDTHEFGFGVYFVGVTNSTIDNVYVDHMTGDCFAVHSTGARNSDGTQDPAKDYSENIIVKNCTFKGARRNNISPIDIEGLIIEDCIIEGAGEGGSYDATVEGRSWKGVSPRSNIDIEATRSTDEDGNAYYSQRATDIIIRRNTFTNAFGNDISLFTCDNVEIYDNTFDGSIETIFAADTIEIHDNVFTASTYEDGHIRAGISIVSYISPTTSQEYVKNFEVYNNTINGYLIGIIVGGDNQTIYNNTCNDFINTGIEIKSGNNLTLYDNTLASSETSSKGYYQSNPFTVIGLSLTSETVTADEYGILLKGLTCPSDNPAIIDNCTFSSGFRDIDIRNSNYVTVQNSTFDIPAVVTDNNTNIVLLNNNVSASVLTDSIISYFDFNNSVSDIGTGGNDGTPTDITYVTGKSGNAVDLTSGSSNIQLTDSDNLSFTNGTNDLPFSISVYVNWDVRSNEIIAGKLDASFREYDLEFASGQLRFRIYSEGGSANYLQAGSTGFTPTIGQWYHITGTYDGAGNVNLYVDGVNIGTSSETGTYVKMNNTSTNFWIGKFSSITSWTLDGQLDGLVIWDKELSQSEVTTVYDIQNGGAELIKPAIPESNIVSYLILMIVF